jgi:hypothetical protein
MFLEPLDSVKRLNTVRKILHPGNSEVIRHHPQAKYGDVIMQHFALGKRQGLRIPVDCLGGALYSMPLS